VAGRLNIPELRGTWFADNSVVAKGREMAKMERTVLWADGGTILLIVRRHFSSLGGRPERMGCSFFLKLSLGGLGGCLRHGMEKALNFLHTSCFVACCGAFK